MGLVLLWKAVCTAEMLATEYRIIIIFLKLMYELAHTPLPSARRRLSLIRVERVSRLLKPRIILSFSSITKYSRVCWRHVSQRKFDLFFKAWNLFGHSAPRYVASIKQRILFALCSGPVSAFLGCVVQALLAFRTEAGVKMLGTLQLPA